VLYPVAHPEFGFVSASVIETSWHANDPVVQEKLRERNLGHDLDAI